jgi:ribosomal protein S18 acetylase RimI-like enzyme
MTADPRRREANPATIRKLTPADADQAVEVLARAFEDDPFATWFVRADERHAEGMRAFFALALHRLTFPFGECYVTEGVEGAALWNPPGTWNLGFLEKMRLLPQFARASSARRLLEVFLKTNPLTAAHPHDPHWYLFILGVDPPAQGRGLGRALLAPVLERCDAERLPAYLETAKERNLGFYQSLGFAVVGRHAIPGGPLIYFMRREAR